MQEQIYQFLTSVKLGKVIVSDNLSQYYHNMHVFPLLSEEKEGLIFLTLQQAMENKQLRIKEASHTGSVPELKVYNNGKIPVLLLDGEELVGAKQNRAINTSILLKEKSETVIPVSCTEEGRWRYDTEYFHDSDEVMSSDIRSRKMASVSYNLDYDNSYDSNQGEIWEQIQNKAQQMNTHSRTMAMKDIYINRTRDFENYLNAFPIVDGQKGLLVCIRGKVVGFDIVSSKSAYKQYHHKLLRSYAMEAMMHPDMEDKIASDAIATEFLNKATMCSEEKYKSVGNGWDYRYKGQTMVGSCLFYSDTPLHTAFFNMEEPQELYPSYRSRRHYRSNEPI